MSFTQCARLSAVAPAVVQHVAVRIRARRRVQRLARGTGTDCGREGVVRGGGVEGGVVRSFPPAAVRFRFHARVGARRTRRRLELGDDAVGERRHLPIAGTAPCAPQPPASQRVNAAQARRRGAGSARCAPGRRRRGARHRSSGAPAARRRGRRRAPARRAARAAPASDTAPAETGHVNAPARSISARTPPRPPCALPNARRVRRRSQNENPRVRSRKGSA